MDATNQPDGIVTPGSTFTVRIADVDLFVCITNEGDGVQIRIHGADGETLKEAYQSA